MFLTGNKQATKKRNLSNPTFQLENGAASFTRPITHGILCYTFRHFIITS